MNKHEALDEGYQAVAFEVGKSLEAAHARIQELEAQLAKAQRMYTLVASERTVTLIYELEAQLAEANEQVAVLKVQLSEEYRDWLKDQCNEECRFGAETQFKRAEKAEARIGELEAQFTEHDGIECAQHDLLVRVAIEERKRAEALLADAKAEATNQRLWKEQFSGLAESLRQELGYIASAPRCNFEDAEEFMAWAQNRARFALRESLTQEPKELK